MKSSRKKRILATILCMVMVLTSNISALAEGDGLPDMTEQGVTAASVPETPEQEPEVPRGQTQQTSVDSSATVPTTPEVTPETTPVTTPEVTPTTTPETTPGATTTNETPGSDTPANSHTAAGTGEGVTGGDDTTTTVTTPETTVPTPEVTPEETGDVFSEATELTQEFKDAQGQVVQKVTAKLPSGAFAAETSHITMEVQYLDEASENHIKNLMMKQLPEGDELGDYITLSVKFKVDGVETDSLQPIDFTFEKSNLEIKDTKKANVFFFDPANPEVSGDKDELVEITQRSELLESLQAAGQSTATMEEDYDLSSIEIKEENRSGKIVLEGRKSTIYGCYVEKEPEEEPEQPEEKPADIPVLNYEDDKVTVSVTAEEAGVIPEGAELKVLPITSEDTKTKEQYQEVEKKIQEKVAEEEKEVAGFLAYDITFVDKDGNEMEPNGKVKVSMNYKKAELPPEVVEKKATDAEVTVLHLEEDEKGAVKQVVDMAAEQKANVDTLATTEGTKVQNVEVETESFSVFTVVWRKSRKLIDLHGSSITPIKYNELKKAATEGNIPITWTRSTGIHKVSDDQSTSWKWNDLMRDLGVDTLTLKKDYEVWDGSRSSDGYTSDHKFERYLPDDKITVYNGRMYDSATWKLEDSKDNYYRFRGSFDLSAMKLQEGYTYADYDYTIQSVLNEVDKHIYINDNMYVFVYPTDVTLTNDNYMDYLSFWTGTSNQKGVTEFNERQGTQAYRPSIAQESGGTTSIKELAYITDGWYTNPVSDGAGGIIQNALNTGAGTTFYIDVISHDNAEGGAMYRLQLDAQPVSKTEVGFYKVDETLNGIQGVKFTLTKQDDPTVVYPLTSNANGYVHVKVKDGTYILKETAAGGGFEKTENTWTVIVANNTFKIDKRDNLDAYSALETFREGDRKGSYYITNKYSKNMAKLVLEKKFVDEKGVETSAPENLDHITIEVKGSYREESQIYKVKLTYDETSKSYKGEATVKSYYDYEMVPGSEHLWMDPEETKEIPKAGWEFSNLTFSRFDNATITMGEVISDCGNLERAIQDYEFLIIKVNKKVFDKQFYLVLNHKEQISEATIQKIIEQSGFSEMNRNNTAVIDFDEMQTELRGKIIVTKGDAGSNTLKFEDKDVWQQFQVGQMDTTNYTINGTITNVLKSMSIEIQKEWIDADNHYNTRLNSITVEVVNKETKEVVQIVELKPESWNTTVENLPVAEYEVREQEVNGYDVSYSKGDNGEYIITNTLKLDWYLYKISENKNADGSDRPLKGAEFELSMTDTNGQSKRVATFTTDLSGKAHIQCDKGYEILADGDYTLKETVAPLGYIKSDKVWTLTIKDEMPIALDWKELVKNDQDGSIAITITNQMAYELPSTGGPGIFVYTIGGTLLLMAAALLIYKMKREEVLKG